MWNKQAQKWVLAIVVPAISGCAINPPYVPAKEEKTAVVRLLGMSTLTMCKGGTFYDVSAQEAGGVAPVPAGERISVGSYMSYGGYNVTYSCYPFLSFVPKQGETYVVHSFLRGDRCFIELVREDKTKATGVTFEPSIGPRDCYKR